MKDIFLDFETNYNNYKSRKDLYEKMCIYQFDILESSYKSIIELKPGNDSICLDNISYGEYVRLVSRTFKEMVRDYQEHLSILEKELIGPSSDYRAICSNVKQYGMISCDFLLELFKELGIEYKDVYIHDDIKDEEGITLLILDNGEYIPYSFFGSHYLIRMLEVKNDEIVFDSKLEYLLGTDFIRFYINYEYNTDSCDIKAICSEYKKTCLNR